MRCLAFLLACSLVVMCSKMVINYRMYQIQGVEVDDARKFGIQMSSTVFARSRNPRRGKREIVEAVSSNLVAGVSGSAFESPHAHARVSRHFPILPNQYVQQPQLQQQSLHQQQQFQQLPINGFAPESILQQQELFSQLQLQQQFAQLARPAIPSGFPKQGGKKSKKSTHYYYPPRQRLPLPQCFHNPTGYVCCNEELNDLMVDTWTSLEQRPKFQGCNIQLITTLLQINAQRHFNTSFETIVGYSDFAQKINFRGDLVCKVELGNRFLLAYATATDAYNHDLAGLRREKRETNEEFEWSSGTADSWHSIHTSFI